MGDETGLYPRAFAEVPCAYCGSSGHLSADCAKLVADPAWMHLVPGPGHERPIERIDELLEELRAYWHLNPDLRLGQIVGNFAMAARRDSYYLEDRALITALRKENERGDP